MSLWFLIASLSKRAAATWCAVRTVLVGATMLGASTVFAQPPMAQPPLIFIDPGHTPLRPGAISARALPEVQYNDTMAHIIGETLQRAGFRVAYSRQPGQEITLKERARIADSLDASLMLSIHHDAAQVHYLQKAQFNGMAVLHTSVPLRGYSLFVSQRNPRYQESLLFALALGKRLRSLGRPPTLHHAENIDGENRPLLDSLLGIYRFDDLVVLKETACPAILIECGVLVDTVDERYVSDTKNRIAIASAIAQAVGDWKQFQK